MKKVLRFLLILFFPPLLGSAQPGTWTWINGDSTTNSLGNYGLIGVPSTAYSPHSRYAPGFWTDTAGKFWVYGGGNGNFSDLWRFDPLTLEWTWFGGSDSAGIQVAAAPKGVFSTQNWPGALGWGIFSWVTPDNHFWIFGGDYHGTTSNALWQFDPSVNQWAWMGGIDSFEISPVYGTIGVGDSLNNPGNRYESNDAWVDSNGNLWLYGGYADVTFIGATIYYDLWEYNIQTGYWICWNTGNGPAIYGTKDVAAAHNYPPERITNLHWQDSKGNFFLAGGGVAATFNSNYFHDIWKYTPDTHWWTWIGGPQYQNDDSTSIVSDCDTNEENGGKYENRATWKINDNLIINSGGVGFDQTQHNDMWGYVPSIDDWVKIGEAPLAGHYGTKLVSDTGNFPPVREGSAGWLDRNGNLWEFGGASPLGVGGDYNDLWKYVLDTGCVQPYCGCLQPAVPVNPLQATAISSNSLCATPCNGTATSHASNGTPPYHYLWTPGNITSATDSNLCAGTYYVKITDSLGAVVSDTVVVTAPPPPSVILNPDTTIICSGDTAALCIQGSFGEYLWNNGQTTSCIYTQATGNYRVTVTGKNDCKGVSNYVYVGAGIVPPVSISVKGDSLISTAASSYQWYLNGVAISGAQAQVYLASGNGTYLVSVIYPNGCMESSGTITHDVTGIDNPTNNNWVRVWPNPSSGSWQVTIDNSLKGSMLQVFDCQGKLVYSSTIQNVSFELDLSVAPGIYLLHIQSGQNSYVKKIVRL